MKDADFIRAQGAVPGIQLGHGGRKSAMQRPWDGNGPLTAENIFAIQDDIANAIVGALSDALGVGDSQELMLGLALAVALVLVLVISTCLLLARPLRRHG